MTKTTEILLARMDAHRTEVLNELKRMNREELKPLKEEIQRLHVFKAKLMGAAMVLSSIVSLIVKII